MSRDINCSTAQPVSYNMVAVTGASETPPFTFGRTSHRQVHRFRSGLRLLRRNLWIRWAKRLSSTATWFFRILLIALLGVLLSRTVWPVQSIQRSNDEPSQSSAEANDVESSLDSDWVAITRIGHDSQGRQAELRLFVLNKDFQWRFGSDAVVEYLGLQFDISPHLLSEGINTQLANAKAVIVVGAASEQGNLTGEVGGANNRAQQLAVWIREEAAITQPVFALNLGQYVGIKTGGTPASTSSQRSIAIISVVASDDGIDLLSALHNALADETPSFPFSIRSYSTFELTELRQTWRG